MTCEEYLVKAEVTCGKITWTGQPGVAASQKKYSLSQTCVKNTEWASQEWLFVFYLSFFVYLEFLNDSFFYAFCNTLKYVNPNFHKFPMSQLIAVNWKQ